MPLPLETAAAVAAGLDPWNVRLLRTFFRTLLKAFGVSIIYPTIFNYEIFPMVVIYRVTSLVANLGWVDLDLGSSPGWWQRSVTISKDFTE